MSSHDAAPAGECAAQGCQCLRKRVKGSCGSTECCRHSICKDPHWPTVFLFAAQGRGHAQKRQGVTSKRVAARVAPTPKRLRPECTCDHEAEQPRYTAAAAGGLHDGIRLLAWSPRRQKVAMFGIIVDHSGKVSSRPALSKHSKEHTLRHTGPPEYCAPSP